MIPKWEEHLAPPRTLNTIFEQQPSGLQGSGQGMHHGNSPIGASSTHLVPRHVVAQHRLTGIHNRFCNAGGCGAGRGRRSCCQGVQLLLRDGQVDGSRSAAAQ